MRLNNKEDLTPICATENVPLFVMYVKGELTEKHKSKLEAHLSHCADCKMNLAYVKEILQFKHPLSADEKTLLLKYLSDPLFYYFIHDIRKKVLSDVRDILKEVNIHIKNNENIEAYKDGKINQPSKLSYQKRPYSYAVMTLAIAGFLSLGSLIVLGLSVKYPALQSYLPFSNSTSPVVEERLPSNLNSDFQINLSKATENNLYQQLDTAIDEFLSTKNREHLVKAESIAKDIQLFYEDNYGVDLVSYYKNVPEHLITRLSTSRKKMFELINSKPGDGYTKALEETEQLSSNLLDVGNIIETYRVKTLKNKLHVILRDYELANALTKEGLKFCSDKKYLFLEAYFSLWQAKALTETGEFNKTEQHFFQTISLAEKLSLVDIIINASSSLAAIYHLNNHNEKALTLSQSLLLKSSVLKKEQIITLMQISGLSAFNLQYYSLSSSCLKEAIRLSEEIKNPAFLARSYTLLSLTLAEKKDFLESESYHLKAIDSANSLNDPVSKLNTLSIITGYYAKAKLIEGNFYEAAKNYEQTLEMMETLGLKNHLQLSQLNEGLAIALKATKENKQSQKYLAIANYYRKLADDGKESTNCLLSFIPRPCY